MSSPHVSEPLPSRVNPYHLLTAINSSEVRWPGALRAGLAILLPGAVALLLGFDTEMFLIAAGGCAVIYGEGHPYRSRFAVMATAAALISTGAVAGAFIGSVVWGNIDAGGTGWWLLLPALFATAMATIGAFVQNALKLRPPGAFFIVMVTGGSTMVARLGFNPIEVGLWTAVGSASGVVLGMLPALVDPIGPQRRAVITLDRAVDKFEHSANPSLGQRHQCQTALYAAWTSLADARVISGGQIIKPHQAHLVNRTREAQLRLTARTAELGFSAAEADLLSDEPTWFDTTRTAIPHMRPTQNYRIYRSMVFNSHAAVTAQKVFIAALSAAVVGIALGLHRPDWAIVSALLVLQWGPDRVAGQIRAVHRMIGSLLGVGLFAIFHLLEFRAWSLLIALAACQFFAEVFVVKNYAIATIFTTPLALLLGNAVTDPLGEVVAARTAEIGLSIAFASLALWFWRPQAAAKDHVRLLRRARNAMSSLVGELATHTPAGSIERRRDLQFELLAERSAIQSLAQDDRAVAKQRWDYHLKVQNIGYSLLDYSNANNHRMPDDAEILELSHRVRQLN